jgi:mutator protein MutT
MKNPNSEQFKFCPHCGGHGLIADSVKSFRCEQCRFTFYLNTASAAAALIRNTAGALLVVERKNDPAKGTWDLPGGFSDPGETAEDCLKREVKEELNLTVTSSTYFCSAPNAYEYQGVRYSTMDLAYVCAVESLLEICADDDVSNYFFIPIPELEIKRFGLQSIRRIVSIFLKKYKV